MTYLVVLFDKDISVTELTARAEKSFADATEITVGSEGSEILQQARRIAASAGVPPRKEA